MGGAARGTLGAGAVHGQIGPKTERLLGQLQNRSDAASNRSVATILLANPCLHLSKKLLLKESGSRENLTA